MYLPVDLIKNLLCYIQWIRTKCKKDVATRGITYLGTDTFIVVEITFFILAFRFLFPLTALNRYLPKGSNGIFFLSFIFFCNHNNKSIGLQWLGVVDVLQYLLPLNHEFHVCYQPTDWKYSNQNTWIRSHDYQYSNSPYTIWLFLANSSHDNFLTTEHLVEYILSLQSKSWWALQEVS